MHLTIISNRPNSVTKFSTGRVYLTHVYFGMEAVTATSTVISLARLGSWENTWTKKVCESNVEAHSSGEILQYLNIPNFL